MTGEIPAGLENLTSLELLSLSDDQLNGAVPAELANLPNLWGVMLSENQLSGCVPQGLWYVPLNDFGELGLSFWESPIIASDKLDRDALTALYNATDGPNWATATNRLKDIPLYQWHGVTVGGNGRGVALDES